MNIGLENVTFSYDDKPICRDLSWQLPESGILCLWGPSGCGKTTLLRLLAGLERPAQGHRLFPAEGQVSFVFQEDRLLPWETALDNVLLPGTDAAVAGQMLARMGLAEEMNALPGQLSGGQQRRVALARALAAPGDLLLLDEPFNGLDEAAWRQVVPLIKEVAVTRPVVIVTHLQQQAEALGAVVLPLSGMPLSGRLG